MLITTLSGGGAERVPSELSLNLNKKINHRIVLLKNKISYPVDKQPISMNFDFSKPSFYSIFFTLVVGTLKYKKLIKKYNTNVSMSFLVMDNFINILSNIFNKKTKVIVSVHATLSNKFKDTVTDKIAILFIKKLYNHADVIIAVSEGVRDELQSTFRLDSKKIRVISNPINISQIEHLKNEPVEEAMFLDGVPVIINVGRLNEVKGQWHLIRAFSKVRSRKKCKLCILGEGHMRSKLEELIADLDLNDDVFLLGWKENPYKYIYRSSWFVLSSISEALPYSIIEAMACGCPVISTDCNFGPREILGDNKYGLLVPPMDLKYYDAKEPLTVEENILADTIIKNIDDNETIKKYSELGIKRSFDFDITKIINIYENMIYEVI
jgi:glycosyltransferase involved in cell wall biosynthesis